jgi:hypothetical protein
VARPPLNVGSTQVSHAAGLEILIFGAVGLMEALAETGLECVTQRRFETEDGKAHEVDLVVTDPKTGARIGMIIDAKTGTTSYVAHDCRSGGVKGKELAGRVVQRYAYVKAVEELRRKGYKVAKEETAADGTISVVAQKWK